MAENFEPQPPNASTVVYPTGIVTFLFTDIAGSTQRWERHQALMHVNLAQHDALLRAAIARHGGVVIKGTGDGLLAAFAQPADALAAALVGQRELASAEWGEAGPLRVRMALHSGEARLVDGDYFGPTLNRTARLLSTGHGGQILISRAAAELVRDRLPASVRLRDMGTHQLKDLSRPEQIFQAVADDLPADFPPLRTRESRIRILPTSPNPLIGRETELANIATLLDDPGVRLLTLLGPGGTGKTRLALQVAVDREGRTADGVCFVDLAPVRDPTLVLPTIGQTLSLQEAHGQPMEDVVAAFLREKQLLLVLDNCEQVVDAAPVVASLLAAALRLQVVATSREALRVAAERLYLVPPLGVPVVGDDSLSAPAAQLFLARARAGRREVVVTGAASTAVAAICRRLDGLPLALELAAARLRHLTPQALLARLERPLDLLTGGLRDLPTRQQSLRAAIGWSYELLTADEQALFRRLGVFVDGWTLEAAEAVGGIGDSDAYAVFDTLAALVDHSLVIVLEPAVGAPRYGMLATLREYALEQLRAMGEELEVRRRCAAYYATWAEALTASLAGADLLTSEPLVLEIENLRATLHWSLASQGEDARYGLRMFGCLWPFWYARSWYEGASIVKQALTCALVGPQDLVAARIYNAASRMPSSDSPTTESIELLERGFALARQYHDRALEAEILRHLGEELQRHDIEQAEQALTASLSISRELGDLGQESWTTYELGKTAGYRGDSAGADRLLTHSLALFMRLGHQFGQAIALRDLACLSEARGDSSAADAYLAQALAVAEQLGPTSNHSPWFEQSQIAFRRGDIQRAAALLQSGYDQALQRGDAALQVLLWLALCHQERGDLDAATVCCRQALSAVFAYPFVRDDLRILGVLTAYMAVRSGENDVGAQLLGCVAAESSVRDFGRDPEWARVHELTCVACRDALGEVAFTAAWEAGRTLKLEQAVEVALIATERARSRKSTSETT